VFYIRASLNLGLSKDLKEAASLPRTVPVKRPEVENNAAYKNLSPEWVAGFATGESNFFITVQKSKTKSGLATWLRFSIGQHSRDLLLLEILVNFFETPTRRRGNLSSWALPSNKSWYSTTCVNGVTKDGNPKGYLKDLNPFYVSGLVDGEGTFAVSIYKSEAHKTGWRLQPSFSIELHKKDLILLNSLQSFFFSVGTIRIRGRDGQGIYSKYDLEELTNVIIPHFDKYPLLTQKRADYLLFKQVVAAVLSEDG